MKPNVFNERSPLPSRSLTLSLFLFLFLFLLTVDREALSLGKKALACTSLGGAAPREAPGPIRLRGASARGGVQGV